MLEIPSPIPNKHTLYNIDHIEEIYIVRIGGYWDISELRMKLKGGDTEILLRHRDRQWLEANKTKLENRIKHLKETR